MGLHPNIQLSAARWLFDNVRFNVESPHDDWEFVLRLSKQAEASIDTVPEVLVVLYFEEERLSLTTRTSSWSASLRWLEGIRPILTRRAYSGFCLGVVGSRAAREGAYKAFPELLHRAFRNGGCCEVCYTVGWVRAPPEQAACVGDCTDNRPIKQKLRWESLVEFKEMNNELAR